MVYLIVVSLSAISLLDSSTPTVNPGCQCVDYDGFGGARSNGSFMSPNWPEPYEQDIDCLLYQFVGANEELVELIFHQFELAPRDPKSGRCTDYIRLYQDLQQELAIDEQASWQYEFCGHDLKTDRSFYSRDRVFIFEFHSDRAKFELRSNKGFVGEYRFLQKRNFQTDGRRSPKEEAQCEYTIESTDDRTEGNIFSPSFPYNYPNNCRCSYRLYAKSNQNIRITVRTLEVKSPSDSSCDFASNYLAIYEDDLALISKLCQPIESDILLSSSRQSVLIEFVTGPNEDFRGRGFHIVYRFTDELPTPPPIHKHNFFDQVVNKFIKPTQSRQKTDLFF